jgi:hypothetical protein
MMLEIRSRTRIEEAERGTIYFILLLIREFRLKRRLQVFSDSSPDFKARVLEKFFQTGDRTREGSFPARNSRPLSLTKHRGPMRCWESGDRHDGDSSKWFGTMTSRYKSMFQIEVLTFERSGSICYRCQIIMFESENCNIYIVQVQKKNSGAS